jgi:hypothetical protein
MNSQFEHWISTSGLTKKELARRIQTRAHAKGLTHVSTAASRIRGWIEGQQPAEAAVTLIIAEVLTEACQKTLTAEDLGFHAPVAHAKAGSPELAGFPRIADAVEIQSRVDLTLSAHDLRVERNGLLRRDSLLDVAEHIALGRPLPLPDPASSARIDHQHVALIQQTTNVFRRWDNEFGGGMRRKAIVGQLNETSSMLPGPFRDEQVGRQFFSAVADLAQLAGWMSYDLEFHATAQRYFLLGMQLARDAGDRLQVARMLYCLARQMVELARYPEALDLGQTGVYAIRRSATPKASALLFVIQARAYAGMGDATGCYSALKSAEDAFMRAGRETDPAWCDFFDEGELCGSLGVSLRDLALASVDGAKRYAADAQPWIERAIEHRQAYFLRSRIMDIDSLAVVNIILGEPDLALKAAGTAIAMAGRVASSRLVRRLHRTTRLAHHHFPGMPGVADLTDQARTLAVGTTSPKELGSWNGK